MAAWSSRLWTLLRSGPWRALILILLLALVLTVGHLRMSPISLTTGETDTWWPVVDSIEDGHGYAACFPGYFPFCGPTNRMTAAREPAPVLLFAGIAILTQDSFRTAAPVQVALNLAIVIGVYMLACELGETRTALLAALFWALYFPALRSEIGQVTGDLLAATCIIWGVFLFLRAQRTDRVACWLGAGACLGVATLSRSATAIVALVLALGMLIAGLYKARATLRSVLTSLRLVRALGSRVITLPLARAPFAPCDGQGDRSRCLWSRSGLC